MTSKKLGLIDKYYVERHDGKPVAWCFVLEDRDPLTPAGLVAYAAVAWEAGYRRLHADLVAKIAELQEQPGALCFEDECDRCGHPRGAHYVTFDAKLLGCSSPDVETDEGVERVPMKVSTSAADLHGSPMCGCLGFLPRPEAA